MFVAREDLLQDHSSRCSQAIMSYHYPWISLPSHFSKFLPTIESDVLGHDSAFGYLLSNQIQRPPAESERRDILHTVLVRL